LDRKFEINTSVVDTTRMEEEGAVEATPSRNRKRNIATE
jgi:hypothetical protein